MLHPSVVVSVHLFSVILLHIVASLVACDVYSVFKVVQHSTCQFADSDLFHLLVLLSSLVC